MSWEVSKEWSESILYSDDRINDRNEELMKERMNKRSEVNSECKNKWVTEQLVSERTNWERIEEWFE